MSTALVKPSYTTEDVQRGGIGRSSKLLKVGPDTIRIVQRMSAEGTLGKLRIKGTGQEFDEMHLVFLFEPTEQRSMFVGDDFKPENLICFSYDMLTPNKYAREPQALNCAQCKKADWEPYMETKKKGVPNKSLLPPCKAYWHSVVIDRITNLPYYLEIKGTSLDKHLDNGFIKQMKTLARQMAVVQSQGRNPNIFDFSFKIFTEPQQKGKFYTLGFKDFAPIAETDREKFGNIFLEFVNQNAQNSQRLLEEENNRIEAQEAALLEAELCSAPPPTPAVEGEYIPL